MTELLVAKIIAKVNELKSELKAERERSHKLKDVLVAQKEIIEELLGSMDEIRQTGALAASEAATTAIGKVREKLEKVK